MIDGCDNCTGKCRCFENDPCDWCLKHNACAGCGEPTCEKDGLCSPCYFRANKTRVCSKCHKEKPISAFYRTARNRPTAECKACKIELTAAYAKRQKAADPEGSLALKRQYMTDWRRANPERHKEIYAKSIKKAKKRRKVIR